MNRITQYIHRPNLTELGMGNTNDKYLVGPENILKDFFPEGNETTVFDENSDKEYILYSKIENNEFRVKKLSEVYDDYMMDPGDELIFTRHEYNGEIKISLRVNECDRIFLNQGKSEKGFLKDFEIINIERFPSVNINTPYDTKYNYLGKEHHLEICFSEERLKRSDSPKTTVFYSVKYDGKELENIKNYYYYLSLRKGFAILKKLPKYEYEVLFEDHIDNKDSLQSDEPIQQIYYGAPGTGKSHTIKAKTETAEKNGRLVRTTFHPDSDYSTFVGAYKPTMKCSEKLYTLSELKAKLKEVKESGVTYPCHKFAAKYWKSLKDISADGIKQILAFSEIPESMNVEIAKGVAVGQDLLNKSSDGKIIYEFVPQAFTKAYVKAWNTKEDIYLVIEEINRGNCAQIFGDLFQLLDRKGGKSKYPVDSDTDLEKYLSDALAESTRDDFPEGVKEGKKLVLPENLYIWATMNTSDQSLFPIDSAFKRRWNWNFIKIRNYPEKNYKIVIGEEKFDWWSFIKKINEIIASMTSSADKQLGYFFCTPENGEIDEKLFVSKVIFYLWNDVFKDYGFEDASLFLYTEVGDDGKEVTKDLTFPDFYDEAGEEVNTDRLKDFLVKVENWKKTNEENS